MNKLQQIIQVSQNMGGRYMAFRCWYELKRRAGLLKNEFPIHPTTRNFITLEQWRQKASPFFFKSREELGIKKMRDERLMDDTLRILNGDIQFFNYEWRHLGNNYDWLTNPDTGYHYDIGKHWSEVEDLSQEAGDIKFIWEKSRFSYLYTIIRYDYHFDEDHSEFVFNEIADWIEKNPINQGPNYKCSQEISLRILNWTFALYFYRNSEHLSEELFQRMMHSVYWQVCHVRNNIYFSRVSVRNNHAITETLTLYLTSLLYPFFPGARERKQKGKAWFEKEIAYQIYEDGTFLQFSMNYHRVVIQLLTWAIGLAKLNKESFSGVVYEKAYRSLDFLYQCQEESNGWLPNFGSNDGALFFKLSRNDYRDYRPQLDALHQMLTGKKLYALDFEDKGWYGVTIQRFASLAKKTGLISFPSSGYYLMREQDTLTFIHCGNFRDRPAHADNMHIDIWHNGENVLLDAGSYKYNTDQSVVRYFMGTESHNSVMLGDNDQMLKGGRFIWYYWPKCAKATLRETSETFVFEGQVNVFRHLGKDIVHFRRVEKKKNVPYWAIHDEIINKPLNMPLRQIWHIDERSMVSERTKQQIQTQGSSSRVELESNGERKEVEGWCSDYYGIKRPNTQIEFQTGSDTITTTITIER